MTWWCSATREPWDWSFRAYPGIWLAIALLAGAYVATHLSHHDDAPATPADRRKKWWFGLGVVVLWLATDWPLGALGSGYLASAHMVQFLLYTLVAAPLLLMGTPEWMARRLADRLRASGALAQLAKPLVAGITFNVVLVATHAPWTVDTFRTNQVGSMVLDVLWLLSGLLLWLPLVGPLPELRMPSPAARCVYLFLSAGVVPMIPGAVLTFSEFPLYGIYELAPRVGGIDAGDDQQAAGIMMKIGSVPVVWGYIFVTFSRWALRERDENVRPDRVVATGHANDGRPVPTS